MRFWKLVLRKKKSLRYVNVRKESLNKIRIAVFGYGGVGKTSIIKRYLFNVFEENYKRTIEDDYTQVIKYRKQIFFVNILDMAGSYQFPAMRKLAIETCHGFLLVYSIDNKKSFEEVKRLLKIIIETKGRNDFPILLIGNKEDLKNRVVSKEEARQLVENLGPKAEFLETSSRYNSNIDLSFKSIIRLIDEEKIETFREKTKNMQNADIQVRATTASIKNVTKKNCNIRERKYGSINIRSFLNCREENVYRL
ncbi:GTP-binding protein Di-Ras1 [Hydra vulgaris]|uniref:GTP-binding protein Di-Ras1 n=1 Tax=Hydra vulgaris TaxID=6087 RepID=UPI001F5F1D82|nr:GTP-binding protein Di-Ras1-like [Hydra vulgaris]